MMPDNILPNIRKVLLVDNPDGVATYAYQNADAPGTGTQGGNLVAFMNPIGSGRTVQIHYMSVDSYASKPASSTGTVVCRRITAFTSGNVDSASISKFDTTSSDSVLEFRIQGTGVTLTADRGFASFAPAIQGSVRTAMAGTTQEFGLMPQWGPLLVRPGEGLTWRNFGNTNDANVRWNITVVWSEM